MTAHCRGQKASLLQHPAAILPGNRLEAYSSMKSIKKSFVVNLGSLRLELKEHDCIKEF